MVPPERSGGLSPAVAGAVSTSRPDATRRAYSGQWRQFAAWADDAGVPWLPAAPVDTAEYLTALVGEPVFPRCGRRGPSVLRLRPAVRRPVVRTAFSAFNGPFRCASLCPGLPVCRDFPTPQPR